MPVTVASSTADMLGVFYSHQRKLFYAKGRFWLFYGNGSQGAFKTSVDGINWSSETTFGYGDRGWTFSVVYDGGDYVHVAWGAGADLWYRRGFLNADGTITWSSDWLDTGIGPAYYPYITLDSDGYPWIGYHNGLDGYPYVVKSSMKDGTWATASGFPYCLGTALTGWANALPVPLTNGKVFVFYSGYGDKLYGKLYDGSWGSEETLSDYVTNADMDAIAEDDAIHFIYANPDSNWVRYNKRNSDGTLNTEVTIESTLPFRTRYSVSIDKSTGILYIFYSGVSSVRLCRKVGGSFESPIDYVAGEGGGGMPIRVFSEKYARYIGVAWHASTDLRFQTYVILPSGLKNAPNSGL